MEQYAIPRVSQLQNTCLLVASFHLRCHKRYCAVSVCFCYKPYRLDCLCHISLTIVSRPFPLLKKTNHWMFETNPFLVEAQRTTSMVTYYLWWYFKRGAELTRNSKLKITQYLHMAGSQRFMVKSVNHTNLHTKQNTYFFFLFLC